MCSPSKSRETIPLSYFWGLRAACVVFSNLFLTEKGSSVYVCREDEVSALPILSQNLPYGSKKCPSVVKLLIIKVKKCNVVAFSRLTLHLKDVQSTVTIVVAGWRGQNRIFWGWQLPGAGTKFGSPVPKQWLALQPLKLSKNYMLNILTPCWKSWLHVKNTDSMLKTLTPVVTYTARERLDYSELEDVYLVLEEDGTEVRQDNTIQYTNLLLLTRSPYRRQRFSVFILICGNYCFQL